jgi:hypothetical protein
MATDSKTTTSGATPDMSQIGNQLATNLASADEIAAQRVQTLAWIHQARAAQLSRTAASLKAQYGADDPGVKAAEAAVAAANLAAARVSMVRLQLVTPDPQVASNGWALHGRVFDAQNQPLSGFTVFLVDDKKAYQQAFGFTYTDDTGYFLLNYGGTPASLQDTSQDADRAAAVPQLFVEIVDTKARPLYLSTAPFQPALATATYQNVTLSLGNHPIGDPPPEIRNIALPGQKKQSTRKRKG